MELINKSEFCLWNQNLGSAYTHLFNCAVAGMLASILSRLNWLCPRMELAGAQDICHRPECP